ncbi:MAG: hypothetical protein AB7E51_02350 [Pseudodesulfovibrio sp.]|uniref:hypothetical protein n=1 Tax=Pseudodesulfovibrio sp. TaxID=2035812 RepID=UPI003D116283
MKYFSAEKVRPKFGFVIGDKKHTVQLMPMKDLIEWDIDARVEACLKLEGKERERALVNEKIEFIVASSDMEKDDVLALDGHTIQFLYLLANGIDPEASDQFEIEPGE